MKEQIVELRIKIDGLSQLIEGLVPKTQAIDFLACPRLEEELLEAWIERAKSVGAYKESLFSNSKEVQKAYDSLILAKAWLGKILGELGEATPYVNDGKRKEVGDIEPTADSLPIVNTAHFWDTLNHIQKVDWLRQEIEKIVNQVSSIGNPPNPPMLNREASIARTNSYNHLCEARFWLGFELGRIRNGQTEFNVYI